MFRMTRIHDDQSLVNNSQTQCNASECFNVSCCICFRIAFQCNVNSDVIINIISCISLSASKIINRSAKGLAHIMAMISLP